MKLLFPLEAFCLYWLSCFVCALLRFLVWFSKQPVQKIYMDIPYRYSLYNLYNLQKLNIKLSVLKS